ncbi:hypothetical protein SUNI508_04325 [Seiridium unicorne]|uniref:Zn(2)-C6 fungal-type domain-containing protein n=1 Tax=Seiridium unicorne TaxID=138068 RepID=A0ABR2VA82_9PEZI
MWKPVKHPGACRECRKRRLKCDESKPYCFKCQKNGRICSGYTDWSQLTVRDMTASTINRVRNAEQTSKRQQSKPQAHFLEQTRLPTRPKSRQDTLPHESGQLTTSIRTNPSPSLDDQAMSYLRTEFIDQQPLALDPGYSHLLRIILRQDRIGDCLSACLTAASLAAFSTRRDAKMVESGAQKAYTTAISAINTAIQRPNAAEDDQLLASVLLLAFYENHIFGAASMIKTRKTKAVLEALPAQLYLVVRYELCRTSLLGFADPEGADVVLWLQWRSSISSATFTPNALAKVNDINESTMDHHIRSMMDSVVAKNPVIEVLKQHGLPEDVQSAKHLVVSVVTYVKSAVDRFTDMETTAFVTQGSKPLRLPRPVQRDSVFPDAYPQSPICVYKNMHHAVFHLWICLARVSCLTYVTALTSQIKFETGFQDMPAYQAIAQRARDDLETIVSSTPYICGWTAEGTHVFSDAPDGKNRHPQARQTCFATNFIAWALMGPATNPLATDEQKAYLMHMARWQLVIRGALDTVVLHIHLAGDPRLTECLPELSHFLGHRPKPQRNLGHLLEIFWAIVGVFVGLTLIEVIGQQIPLFQEHNAPLIVGSFGAAAVLEFYAIGSPLSQPRNAVIGQVLASVVGVGIRKLFELGITSRDLMWLGGPVSCALATAVMALTGTVHPPAGATALLAVVDDNVATLGWSLLPVILLGCIIMQCVALLLNNIQRRFPMYWWSPEDVGHRWKRGVGSTAGENNNDGMEKIETCTSHEEDMIASPVARTQLTIGRGGVRVPEGMRITPEELIFLETLCERL